MLTKQQIDEWLLKIAEADVYDKLSVIKSAPAEAKKAMYIKMAKSTEYFASVCLKHVHPYIPYHHAKAFSILDNPTARFVCQVWGRKMGKSTVKRAKVFQAICLRQKKFIVLFSETYKQAKSDGVTIMNEISKNRIIRELFGDLKGKGPWGQEHMQFSNGSRVMVFSMTSSVRGMNMENQRPDLILLDDFEGEDNTATPEMREKLIDFVLGVIKPMGSGAKTLIGFLGTVVHHEAFLAKANPNAKDDKGELTEDAKNSWFQESMNGYYTEFPISEIAYDGTTDDIRPIWPEEYSLQYIKEEYFVFKSKNKLSLFYQEYYNIPKTISNPVINVDMIKKNPGILKFINRSAYIEYPNGVKQVCRIFMGVDLNVKVTTNSDDFVIFVLGLLPDKTYVIVDIFADKIPTTDHANMVVGYMRKYSPYTTNIECVQYQLSLYENVKKICRERNYHYLTYPINKRINKARSYVEIDGLCHVVNTGLCSVLSSCNNYDKFVKQAKGYSTGVNREHDDTLDGFYLALQSGNDKIPQNMLFPPETDVDELVRREIDRVNRVKKKDPGFMGY